MEPIFKESTDSVLVNGLAFFGKRGKRMLITSVREFRPRRNSRKDLVFLLVMRSMSDKNDSLTPDKMLRFHLGEIRIEKMGRSRLVYHFLYDKKRGYETLTILLASPDEIVIAF